MCAVLFSVLLFTCGFKIKVKTVYPEEEQKASSEETEVFQDNSLLSVPVPEAPKDISIGGSYYEYGEVSPEVIAPAVLPEIIEDNGADIFLVGDSRTVYGYMDTLDERANWLAACGTSYPYFIEHYISIIDKADLKGKKIVILYGVNDISYYGKENACLNWINFYNSKAQEWIRKGASVYACSVLGFNYRSLANKSICTYTDISTMNKAVDSYNALIESMLPANIGYIKLHYTTDEPLRDGVHYSVKEDAYIYEGIINYLSLN